MKNKDLLEKYLKAWDADNKYIIIRLNNKEKKNPNTEKNIEEYLLKNNIGKLMTHEVFISESLLLKEFMFDSLKFTEEDEFVILYQNRIINV